MIDVLVVGAGPTGLMMAAEAARYGLSCRIIDKSPGPRQESRAIGIQARTLEIFDQLGIVEPFLKNGLVLHAVNPMSRGTRIAHVEFGSLDSPYPFILCLEQSKTERFLTEHLASFGVSIEWGKELVTLTQEGLATLRNPSGAEEILHAQWIVGCDGAHSFVRKAMNLTFTGKTFADIYSLADLEIHWKHPHDELFAFPDAAGIAAAFPLPGKNRYRLIFQLERCRGLQTQEEILPPTLEEIGEILHKYAGPDAEASNPRWLAHFRINSRLASSYRKGRFFLAGDAAHIHSPVGAQGMNTGLQDAFNLAWKLAFGQEELLDTYQLERHGFGKKLLSMTERASQLISLRNPFLVNVRNRILGWLLRRKGVQQKILRTISQTAIRYPKSSIVKEGPLAGERLPNRQVEMNGTKTDLYTLLRKPDSYALLLFSKKSFPSHLKTYHFDSNLEEAFLVRPDLYISAHYTDLDTLTSIPVEEASFSKLRTVSATSSGSKREL